MNRCLSMLFACIFSLSGSAAWASQGEYWEVTSKMEMPGMPFAMPATTTKVCIAKGNENDPRKSSGDKDCQMSDIKTVGNKTSFKVRCNRDGEEMVGTGEQTTTAKGSESKMHFSGKSGGRDMDMTMTSSSKRTGESCDPDEIAKTRQKEADKQSAQAAQMRAQGQKATAEMCDLSNKKSAELIQNRYAFLGQPPICTGKKQEYCDFLRKDASNSIKAYEALADDDKITEQAQRNERSLKIVSIAKECKLSLPAILKANCQTINVKNIYGLSKYCPAEAKALCKTINGKSYDQLAGFCPAEAKTFRETHRREYCEGRGYTVDIEAHIKDCLAGQDDPNDPAAGIQENAESGATQAESQKSAPAKSKSDAQTPSSEKPASSTSTNVLEGAKKLKGLFGF